MTKPPKKESPKTSVSPSSGYVLYGRGRQEDYDREVQRVKTELRREIYGEPKVVKKRSNVAAIVIFIATITSVLVTIAFAVLQKMGQGNGIRDIVGILAVFPDEHPLDLIDETFGSAVCVLGAFLFLLITMIGSACSIKNTGIGKLIPTTIIIWLAALVALTILEAVQLGTLPIEELILTLIAAVALIGAIAGRKKGGK